MQQRHAGQGPSSQNASKASPAGLVLRLVWMIFGGGSLLLTAGLLAQDRPTFPHVVDFVYFAIAAAMIGARWLDITKFEGTTAEGSPATMADFRKYALKVLIGAPVVWGLARGLTIWL